MNTSKNIIEQLFGTLKKDTIRRNTQRSSKWLFNKIRKSRVLKTSRPKVGGLYLYVYDPKTKDTLPYYDISPLVIIVELTKDGFYGLNFHYLRLEERKILLKELLILYSSKNRQRINISYQKLKAMGNVWKYAFKRYLFSHLQTKLIPVHKEEWEDMIALPIATFKKESQRTVLQRKN